jgi:signal transduction histidine kinase
VDVTVSIVDSGLSLVVSDDGVGVGDAVDERSGLANMRQRAQRHGGALMIGAGPCEGTRVEWSVPLA